MAPWYGKYLNHSDFPDDIRWQIVKDLELVEMDEMRFRWPLEIA
jgi:hypothetical protein